MSSTRAVFIGSGSLLIQCAQAWRDAGHEIAAIASRSREIIDWAQANGLHCQQFDSTSGIELPDAAFGYLFSIANLELLPAQIVSRATQFALNFHDGPLPKYAGLNAPCWALMAGETEHGVTWHEMTQRVDAGRIARQARFAISDSDTALSLNARCYEEGLASFKAIARDISRGDLMLTPQSGERSYFGRDMRPASLATLDFARSAAQIAALVRALDFGGYANPLARTKIWLGDGVLLARGARVLDTRSGAQPGTVLVAETDVIHIATADGDVALSGLTDASGRPAPRLPALGALLPALDSSVRQLLETAAPRAARGELHWTRAFQMAAPLDLPYPARRSTRAAPSWVRQPLHAPALGARSVAAFAAWLCALTGQERCCFMYSDETLSQQAQGAQPWLSAWVPLNFSARAGDQAKAFAQAVEAAVDSARQAGPYPRDLVTRLGDRPVPLDRLHRIGVSLRGETALAGAEVLLTVDASGQNLELAADESVYSRETIATMAAHLAHWVRAFETACGSLADIPLAPSEEAHALAGLDAASTAAIPPGCVHEAVALQAMRTPDHAALRWHGQAITYADLSRRADTLAAALLHKGVRAGDVVGLCVDRSPELVVGLLAILKTGAAYLPLDPEYPSERIAFMIDDSRTPIVVTTSATAKTLAIAQEKIFAIDALPAQAATDEAPLPRVDAASPAYLIYTSGSTGRPKGVVVTHANVMNFFAGMDERIPHEPPGRWLAVTSLSFDISVLELCWTLARGFTVALHSNTTQTPVRAGPEFSLFYFASDNASSAQDRYKLLMEGAKFADQNGFSAIWTPERHFHAFGGLYPNPAVTSAAIAAATTRLKIRAGSCVLPLHHPIRVAEEWAFVDNISQGRVGVSFASGWQPNDFVIAPQAFANRKNEMLANIDVVRRLWRGESVSFPGPLGKPVEVRTLPRPIQPELPVWVTAAGNPETFEQAGQMGCHLLTHLLGQNIADVADKLQLYRRAWRRAGHAGNGHVTLMLHSFVGQDEEEVREIVRGPMKAYLRSSVDLIKQAAWSFPTFVQRAAENGRSPVEIMDAAPLSEDEMDALLEHAFSRYCGASALFGTPERCLALVGKLRDAGVDEIACLIDFGIASDIVLAHLHDLKQVMDASQSLAPSVQRVSVAEQIEAHEATHLQCTPSMASMLIADAPGRAALSRLRAMMVGGEALSLKLAKELRALLPGALLNMYGPTETTIWSTTCELKEVGEFVPLGRPIANTRLRVRTPWGADCPALVPGELSIGGAGVAQGYHDRPELTSERFIRDATPSQDRLYRTGDLVRRHPDGALEFLGRIDHQVKLRGHRIELGEIESVLGRQPGVKEAVVVARGATADEQRLVGYVTAAPGARCNVDVLRQALARELPEVMVPQVLMVLPALPLTPNGKVDRHGLPDPELALVLLPGAEPQSELESTIASIWKEVLGLAQVGTTDNFFDLGGHSLLVVQVQRRLREACGREVSITDMFRLPTIRSLAAHLTAHLGGSAPVASAVGDGLNRANARKLMRARPQANAAPVA